MTVSKYHRELTEMTRLWNCSEREAMLIFLHIVYTLRGYSPEKAAEFTNHLPDDYLAYCFTSFMDDRFAPTTEPIDLLSIKPWEPRGMII
ncbi:hypothetical protein [Ruminococcus sp.]|uniref:hypothetical protein n=1 Tax=Ruminococcus sp. TaxID=41978 RepID=UPI002E8075AA|nr:hypothetical protein [Ruminococcus sp.]MEE3492182.1 hypothetical protein [Ruminococcus sp.]